MKQEKQQRGAEKTRNKILRGLENLITRDGFTAVGINAVAREAGVDKVLIYRYFGSMEGLLEEFAEKKRFWPNLIDLYEAMPENSTKVEVITHIILEFTRIVQENQLAQELLRWELSEQNPLTVSFVLNKAKREIEAFVGKGIFPEKDMVIFITILIHGLQFMILRGKNMPYHLGIDCSDPSSMTGIERVIAIAVEAFAEKNEAEGKLSYEE